MDGDDPGGGGGGGLPCFSSLRPGSLSGGSAGAFLSPGFGPGRGGYVELTGGEEDRKGMVGGRKLRADVLTEDFGGLGGSTGDSALDSEVMLVKFRPLLIDVVDDFLLWSDEATPLSSGDWGGVRLSDSC